MVFACHGQHTMTTQPRAMNSRPELESPLEEAEEPKPETMRFPFGENVTELEDTFFDVGWWIS